MLTRQQGYAFVGHPATHVPRTAFHLSPAQHRVLYSSGISKVLRSLKLVDAYLRSAHEPLHPSIIRILVMQAILLHILETCMYMILNVSNVVTGSSLGVINLLPKYCGKLDNHYLQSGFSCCG